jgi:ferredoxin
VLEPSGKTAWSPKEFLLPRTESLYGYSFAGGTVQMQPTPLSEQQQVLFGVRACDAAGLVRLDDIFLSGTRDALYAARRANTIVVSTACGAADPECFCTAVGGSPVGEEGVDVQLLPVDGGWLLRPLSDRGAELVGDGGEGWETPDADVAEQVAAVGQRVGAEIERNPVKTEWSEVLEAGFEHGAWERLTQNCLGCSICASVCPSCSCFDMNHDANAWGGSQNRSWDACTFANFTVHASGHNPRSTKQSRYRQRVLHKFAFRDSDEDPFRCVGCGRCVAMCPTGLDIVSTVAAAVEAIREEGSDAAAR